MFFVRMDNSKKTLIAGQWLWLSWQSSCFRFQRSVDQIQSTIFYSGQAFTVNCLKEVNRKRSPGMSHRYITFIGFFTSIITNLNPSN